MKELTGVSWVSKKEQAAGGLAFKLALSALPPSPDAHFHKVYMHVSLSSRSAVRSVSCEEGWWHSTLLGRGFLDPSRPLTSPSPVISPPLPRCLPPQALISAGGQYSASEFSDDSSSERDREIVVSGTESDTQGHI